MLLFIKIFNMLNKITLQKLKPIGFHLVVFNIRKVNLNKIKKIKKDKNEKLFINFCNFYFF